MPGITTLFKGESEQAAPESDKLLDLFRNRAELKKAFAALRDEKYQLQDRVKQHQGATARVQQKLNHLENLLLDPEWVHNVVVFYQLRRLGMRCQKRLAQFAEQLKQQREKRAHAKLIDAWDAEKNADAERIQRDLGERRMRMQLLEDQLQSERHRLATMNGISKLLHGSELEGKIADIELLIAKAQKKENELLAQFDQIHERQPPEPPGIDTATKRSINFMVLAFAQQMYLHYAEDDLASLAREASQKSVGAINYGSKKDCDRILRLIEKRGIEPADGDAFADEIQARARKIGEGATFRNDDDAVPVPASVATVFQFGSNGLIRTTDVNLLGENYFEISKVLSR